MADTEQDIDDDVEQDASQPEKSMKKKILIYLIPTVILIGIGVGFVSVFFTNVGGNAPQNYDVVTQKKADGSGDSTTVFYTLPAFSAKLRTSVGVFETIQLKLSLELSSVDDVAVINGLMPRINDIIITHLVELTPEEVSGAEGFYALKTELLHRINLIAAPIKVANLNIKDLNIQVTDTLEKQED